MTKAETRRKVRAGRAKLTRAEVARRGETIADCLERHIHPRAVVAGYVPLPGEPDVLPFLKRHAARTGRVYVPVVPPSGRVLRWKRWTPHTPMRQHKKLPISEPSKGTPEDIAMLVEHASAVRELGSAQLVLLIPTLALDSTGARLGQGGGYYDTTAEVLASVLQDDADLRCELIAVVHSEEIVESGAFPVEGHDLRVARAVTECRVFDI